MAKKIPIELKLNYHGTNFVRHGLCQEILTAKHRDIEVNITSGAGLNNPYIEITVQKGAQKIYMDFDCCDLAKLIMKDIIKFIPKKNGANQ